MVISCESHWNITVLYGVSTVFAWCVLGLFDGTSPSIMAQTGTCAYHCIAPFVALVHGKTNFLGQSTGWVETNPN